jgi:hypothetical protein
MISVVLPIAALLIALLLVAALYLWWSGDQPETVPAGDGEFTNIASLDMAYAPSMPVAAPSASVPMPNAANELLRVTRGRDGQLIVNVNGATYHNMAEMNYNAEVREHFMSTLRSLAEFAQASENELKIAAVPAVSSTPAASAPAPAPVTRAPAPLTTPADLSEEELARLDAERNTMAGQIEERLQARLIRTAGMEARSIHIYSAPSGGVEILVDGVMYDSVGDIADAEARSVIEASIRDWEAANPI